MMVSNVRGLASCCPTCSLTRPHRRAWRVTVTPHTSMSYYFALICLLLVVGFLLRIDFVFYLAYLSLGIYALGRWYIPRALRYLHVERRFNDHAFLGEPVAVQVALTNLSRLPIPWVQLDESIPAGIATHSRLRAVITLRGGEQMVLSYQLAAQRRGYYRLGPLWLTGGDLFGFVEQTRQMPPTYLTVYPRLIALHRPGLKARLPFGIIASRQPLYDDPARLRGVRDYQSGDSLRQIHWKLSAHTPDLVVKTYQPAIALTSVVALNLNLEEYPRRTRYDLSEWAIVVAGSVAAHLVEQRQAVGLVTNGFDPLGDPQGAVFDEQSGRLLRTAGAQPPPPIPPHPGRAHLIKLLERLARIEAEATRSLTIWLPTQVAGLSWGTTVLVITPHGDETVCQMLHRLAQGGLNPVLLVIDGAGGGPLVRERARRLGFVAYTLANETDLTTIPWRS